MEQEILEILREINPFEDVDRNTELLNDFLDSVNLLLLINELEEKYEIEISLDSLKLEDFYNVGSIEKFINSMRRRGND